MTDVVTVVVTDELTKESVCFHSQYGYIRWVRLGSTDRDVCPAIDGRELCKVGQQRVGVRAGDVCDNGGAESYRHVQFSVQRKG